MCAQRKTTANCVEIAQAVLHHYPRESLEKENAAYNYEFQASPEDKKMWARFRRQRFMTREELQKLSAWKTRVGLRPHVDGKVARNSGEAVEAVTRAAVQVNSKVPNEPALAIGILATLHGVEIAIASAIMTVWDPKRFGIIDPRVWQALRKAAPDAFAPIKSSKGNRRPFRLHEVALYLCVIREIAAQTSLSCREIDKALWVLGEAT